jgi:hypothetical protein
MTGLESSEYRMAQKAVATGIQQQLQVTLTALPEFSTTV